jgi:hypothetical protein
VELMIEDWGGLLVWDSSLLSLISSSWSLDTDLRLFCWRLKTIFAENLASDLEVIEVNFSV